ncbi:thioredoxin [Candidatus Dependentiae bacterium]
MAVIITSKNFDDEVTKSDKPVIIDVYATWCGPCQMIAPIFDELEKELSYQYKFAKINIDEEREIAIEQNVSSVPTFIFIKNGKVVGKETGYMDKESFKSKIEGFLGK